MKWNTGLYDGKHGFVSKYGEDLVELLDPKEGERILDLGCGTGDLTEMIVQKGANVIGLDNSPEMIKAAASKYPYIPFDVRSATDFIYQEKFDAIFSNATLHWVPDHRKAIDCIYNNLKTGGRFVAEFGGKGNVDNIIRALRDALIRKDYADRAEKKLWFFPSLSEYASRLEEAGFRVVFAAHFDRPTLLEDKEGMVNWLRMFASSYIENLDKEVVNEILHETENRLRPTNFKNGNWYADYVRLRVVAYR